MKLVFALVALLSFSVNAETSARNLYQCEMSGEELRNTSTKIKISLQVMTNSKLHKENQFKLNYISALDQQSYNQTQLADDYSQKNLLRWGSADIFVHIDLRKRILGYFDGKETLGFEGFAGVANDTRLLRGSVFCINN